MKKDGWTLTRSDGTEVNIGDALTYSNGLETTCQGGAVPHKPGSTGRVWVGEKNVEREYYPSVFNLTWVKDSA